MLSNEDLKSLGRSDGEMWAKFKANNEQINNLRQIKGSDSDGIGYLLGEMQDQFDPGEMFFFLVEPIHRKDRFQASEFWKDMTETLGSSQDFSDDYYYILGFLQACLEQTC